MAKKFDINKWEKISNIYICIELVKEWLKMFSAVLKNLLLSEENSLCPAENLERIKKLKLFDFFTFFALSAQNFFSHLKPSWAIESALYVSG